MELCSILAITLRDLDIYGLVLREENVNQSSSIETHQSTKHTHRSIVLLDYAECFGAVAARDHDRLTRDESVHVHAVIVHSTTPRVGNRLSNLLCESSIAAIPTSNCQEKLLECTWHSTRGFAGQHEIYLFET